MLQAERVGVRAALAAVRAPARGGTDAVAANDVSALPIAAPRVLLLDLLRLGLRESVWGKRSSGLFSSCRIPQAALKFSHRSDRVTRD